MSIQRLKKEIDLIQRIPPHNIAAWPKDDSLYNIHATLQGPKGTPYSDGEFRLELIFPTNYPISPPTAQFVTPIFHPNVDP
ncbi:MAG: hypothetical protein EZS28_037150, partial [Streblomastix strix]